MLAVSIDRNLFKEIGEQRGREKRSTSVEYLIRLVLRPMYVAAAMMTTPLKICPAKIFSLAWQKAKQTIRLMIVQNKSSLS